MTPKEIAKEWRRMRIGIETCHIDEAERRALDLLLFVREHEDEILAALDISAAIDGADGPRNATQPRRRTKSGERLP